MRRRTVLDLLKTFIILLVTTGLILPATLASTPGAETSDPPPFVFTHGDLPAGWQRNDLLDTGSPDDPELQVEFEYPDPDSVLPRVMITLVRQGSWAPITMEQCLEDAALLGDEAWFNEVAFRHRTDLRMAEHSAVEPFSGEVATFPARISETTVAVEARDHESGDYDMSRVVPPGDDELETGWPLTPPPVEDSTPANQWTSAGSLVARTYCVDVPSGVVFILLGAQPDYLGQAEIFIRTFNFIDSEIVRLCQEAIEFFGKQPDDETILRYSEAEIEAQMFDAMARYGEGPEGSPAYVSWNLGGAMDAIDWLTVEGGLTFNATGLDLVSRMYVFEDPTDPDTFARGLPGTETGLVEDIKRQYEETGGQRLDPGNVFYLALQHTGGDARMASLLAHNSLRSLGRTGERTVVVDEQAGTSEAVFLGDRTFTGIETDRSFFTTYLAPIRGIPGEETAQDTFDNSGVWYHLFGTMFYEMQTRGDTGALRGLAIAGAGVAADGVIHLIDGHPTAYDTLSIPFTNDRTYRSRLANRFEQYIRMSAVGRKPDLEKYCINAWGGKIGSALTFGYLAQRWGTNGARPVGDVIPIDLDWLFEPQPTDPFDTGIAGGAFPLEPADQLPVPPEVSTFDDLWPSDPLRLGPAPPGGDLNSPVSVTWHSDAGTMTLDQRNRNLSGSAPMLILPVYNAEKHTWGASWFDFHQDPYQVSFEAVTDGTLTYSYYEPMSARAATWTADVHEGETLSLDIVPGELDAELVREDGSTIPPVHSKLDELDPALLDELRAIGTVADESGPDSEVPHGSLLSLFWPHLIYLGLVVLITGMLLLALIIVLVRRRPRVQVSTPGPTRPRQTQSRPGAEARERSGNPPGPQPSAGSPRFCSQCGRPATPGDRFCANCGHKLR